MLKLIEAARWHQAETAILRSGQVHAICGLGFITVSHIRWTCFLTKSCQWYCCCGAYPASCARAAVGGPVGRGVESVWHKARWPWAQMQCQDGQYELLTYWPHKAVADVSRRGSQWEEQVKWDNVMVWMMMMIDCLIDWLFDWLIDWLVDWLIDWLVGWLIDWLTGDDNGDADDD